MLAYTRALFLRITQLLRISGISAICIISLTSFKIFFQIVCTVDGIQAETRLSEQSCNCIFQHLYIRNIFMNQNVRHVFRTIVFVFYISDITLSLSISWPRKRILRLKTFFGRIRHNYAFSKSTKSGIRLPPAIQWQENLHHQARRRLQRFDATPASNDSGIDTNKNTSVVKKYGSYDVCRKKTHTCDEEARKSVDEDSVEPSLSCKLFALASSYRRRSCLFRMFPLLLLGVSRRPCSVCTFLCPAYRPENVLLAVGKGIFLLRDVDKIPTDFSTSYVAQRSAEFNSFEQSHLALPSW